MSKQQSIKMYYDVSVLIYLIVFTSMSSVAFIGCISNKPESTVDDAGKCRDIESRNEIDEYHTMYIDSQVQEIVDYIVHSPTYPPNDERGGNEHSFGHLEHKIAEIKRLDASEEISRRALMTILEESKDENIRRVAAESIATIHSDGSPLLPQVNRIILKLLADENDEIVFETFVGGVMKGGILGDIASPRYYQSSRLQLTLYDRETLLRLHKIALLLDEDRRNYVENMMVEALIDLKVLESSNGFGEFMEGLEQEDDKSRR
ncbi:MAG: hypothetical protein NUW37_08460 [Planctomycetes bacterium]|nr:hypothetical protein [Planctomycetota bacterium]